MPEYISEYTHVDGTKWAGPTFRADSFDEARALAMEYPVQPLSIVGQLVRTIELDDSVERHFVTEDLDKKVH
jgi:hypothetical protein